jgi:hypothetical protein
MNHISDEQLENELSILSGMKEVAPPNFFYTRLKARMDSNSISTEFNFPIKPAFIICSLTLFLLINTIFLARITNEPDTIGDKHIEAFAAAYDQTVSN